MLTQSDQDSFRFHRTAFYSRLQSKVGLTTSKAAALRVNIRAQTESWPGTTEVFKHHGTEAPQAGGKVSMIKVGKCREGQEQAWQ
jgi:hypothetical protein